MLDRHIEAASPAELGLWSLRGLAVLDPGLRPELRAGTLLLAEAGEQGRVLAARPVPPALAAQAAGGFPPAQAAGPLAVAMAALFDAAWRASPALREAGIERMLRSAFEELFNHLDPYSRYLTPQEAEAARVRRIGQSALGLRLAGGPRGSVVVALVEPGGTAERIGLRVGDRVLAIDNIPVSARVLAEAAALLEGPPGTAVVLTVQRAGPGAGRRQAVTLPRETIAPETVRAERREDILWLRIEGFANDTDRHLVAALATLREGSGGEPPAAPRGVVLDLRGNRGGLLGQAVAVASAFLNGGTVARTAGRHPDAGRIYVADELDRARGLPVVVLIDGRSASAAEIVAAALADRGRAVTVGSATLGKGLIQLVVPLPNGGELLVSWARVLAPLGWPVQGLGVLPAVCTGLGSEATAATLAALREGRWPMGPAVARQRAARAPVPPAEATALRAACPPAEGRETDLAVAQALIEAPVAYAAALGGR